MYSGPELTRHFLLTILLLLSAACGSHRVALPSDILGLSVGMPKADATARLSQIGVLETAARKRQEIWRLTDSSRFTQLVVAYDGNDELRFVTAFSDPQTVAQPMRFSEIGDLSRATAAITEPHYTYTWEAPADSLRPPYVVTVYGDNPEFATSYSLANKIQSHRITEYPQ